MLLRYLLECDLSATVHYKELSESQFSDLTWKPSEINEIVLPLLRERYQDRCFTAFRFHLSYFQFQNQFLACFVIRDVSVNCEISKHKFLSIGFLRPSINITNININQYMNRFNIIYSKYFGILLRTKAWYASQTVAARIQQAQARANHRILRWQVCLSKHDES